MIRGGSIVFWTAPRWRRVLYRLGVKRHHARLGDVKRAEQLEANDRRLMELFATEEQRLPVRYALGSLSTQRPGFYWHGQPHAGS